MTSHFEEERIFLGEKSNHMVTVTPFMGKVNVYILQFYVNGNGEMKPGKSGITLELEEFEELVKLIPKVQDSIARYELRDTGIPSSPLELDFPVLDLDTVFLPSLPFQSFETKNFWIVNPNFLHHHHRSFPIYHHSSSLPLKISMSIPQKKKRKGNVQMKHRKRATRSQRLLSLNVLTRLLPWRPSKK